MRCSTIKQTGRSSWQNILRWKPKMLIAFLPYFIWQTCHQLGMQDPHLAGKDATRRRLSTVTSSLWISCPFPSRACPGWHPEHTWSYLGSGEGPNWGETDTYLRQTCASRSFKACVDIWLIQAQFVPPYFRADLTRPGITLGSSRSRASRTLPSSGIMGGEGNWLHQNLQLLLSVSNRAALQPRGRCLPF